MTRQQNERTKVRLIHREISACIQCPYCIELPRWTKDVNCVICTNEESKVRKMELDTAIQEVNEECPLERA